MIKKPKQKEREGLDMTASYLYGIWRLHTLGGPGVDEYQAGQESRDKVSDGGSEMGRQGFCLLP